MGSLEKHKTAILNVFHVWDKAIFPAIADTELGATKCAANNESLNHALEILNGAEEETDTESHPQA